MAIFRCFQNPPMLTTEKKPKNDPKLGRFEKPKFEDLTFFFGKIRPKKFFGGILV